MKKGVAFLLSFALLIPFSIFCYDFFGVPKSIQTVVIEKAKLKYDYHIYLKEGQIELPWSQKRDFFKIQIGDTVTIERSPILKITHAFVLNNEKNRINAGDYMPVFFMVLIPFLIFFALLWIYISDYKKGKAIVDDDIGAYYLLLGIGYFFGFIVLFIALK